MCRTTLDSFFWSLLFSLSVHLALDGSKRSPSVFIYVGLSTEGLSGFPSRIGWKWNNFEAVALLGKASNPSQFSHTLTKGIYFQAVIEQGGFHLVLVRLQLEGDIREVQIMGRIFPPGRKIVKFVPRLISISYCSIQNENHVTKLQWSFDQTVLF